MIGEIKGSTWISMERERREVIPLYVLRPWIKTSRNIVSRNLPRTLHYLQIIYLRLTNVLPIWTTLVDGRERRLKTWNTPIILYQLIKEFFWIFSQNFLILLKDLSNFHSRSFLQVYWIKYLFFCFQYVKLFSLDR